MKRIFSFFLLLSVLLMLLGGCDKQNPSGGGDTLPMGKTTAADTQSETDTTDSADSPVTEELQTSASTEDTEQGSLFSEAAQRDIIDVKSEITGNGKMLGVMHLGVCEGTYRDVMKYVQNLGGDLGDTYSWLPEMPEDNFFSGEGMELYAVVPGVGCIMTVYEYGMDPDNDYLPGRGDMLYEGGEPVLLLGNVSDIVPGYEITWDGGSYSPCLSLENGRLLQNDAVYDFTSYDLVMPWLSGGEQTGGDRTDSQTGVQTETQEAFFAESLAGYWAGSGIDAGGYEVLLSLTLTEDGGASYSYGYPFSEMAETFGGTWSMTDNVLAFKLSGGMYDMELGCVAKPYALEAAYSFAWDAEGVSFTVTPISGNFLADAENAPLTFRCTGAVHPMEDPMGGITVSVSDPSECVGEWYDTQQLDDGTDISVHLSIMEDGKAIYRYGYSYGQIIEEFNGSWVCGADGKFYLSMRGGSIMADESEYYDFEGYFNWSIFRDQLTLIHEDGNPLLADKECWAFTFAPFDTTMLDGEWVSVNENGVNYRLQLFDDGMAMYTAEKGETTVCAYTGWWYAPSDELRLDLNMKLTAGDGAVYICSSYDMDWAQFPDTLLIRTRNDSDPLSAVMADCGEDTFHLIDPNAVG